MSDNTLTQQLEQYDQRLSQYRAVGGEVFDREDEENALINYSYHSNAIEGNTFTYEQTYDFLKTGQVVAGKSFEEHAEHRDLVNAWKLMRQFATDQVPLSEGMMLAIHKQVLARSKPEDAAVSTVERYREVAVRVGKDTTPYPAKAKSLMKEMIERFQTFEQKNHPLIVGAKLHLDTVIIHPFRDGNGRTGRLLLDYVLLKHKHPNVLLKVEDKPTYFQAIRDSKAQKDHTPFASFIVQQATKNLEAKITLLEQPQQQQKTTQPKPSDTKQPGTPQLKPRTSQLKSTGGVPPNGVPPNRAKKKAEEKDFDIWQWDMETTDF